MEGFPVGPRGEERVTLSPDMRARIGWEQMRLLRQQLPMVLAAVVANALMLVAVFRNEADPRLLGGWLAAVCVLTLLRWLALRYFDQDALQQRNARQWRFFFVLGSTLSGVLWGATGWLFLSPDDTVLYSFHVILVAGMVAGSLPSLSVLPGAHQGYTIGAMLPMTLAVIDVGEAHYPVAILCFVYLLAMLLFSRTVRQSLVGYLVLQFRNLELVGELREQQRRAEEASEAKSRFLAAASHDLRQPLHALGLFVDALGRTTDPGRRAELQDNVHRSVDALSALLDALLDISRLDAGQVPVRASHLRIDDLVALVVEEHRADAEAAGMRLVQRPCGEVVHTDPVLVRRILDNLVGNALRHAGGGSIEVGCRACADGVEVSVRDEGVGIPEAQQQRVFDEFHQLGNPERRREKGLGIGLAIVRRLAELLNIRVRLESAEGEGCRFSFVLPRGDAGQISRLPVPDDREGLPFAGCRVLLVEDDEMVRRSMHTLLEDWGCRVTAHADLPGVLAALDEGLAVDLVVADMRLPEGRSGYEAIEAVRRRHRRPVPALVITGETASSALERQGDEGIPVMHKPVRPPRLRLMLQRLLQHSAGRGPQADG